VHFDTNGSTVQFLYRNTDLAKIEEIIIAIRKFKEWKQKRKPKISVLVNSTTGIKLRSLEVIKPKLHIEDNYNHDFKEIHRIILKNLSLKGGKGLVLLHGKPGTG